MDLLTVLELGCALGAVLLLYNFRNACTDAAYLFFRHWKYSLFVMICLATGALTGLHASRLDRALASYDLSLTLPQLSVTDASLGQCDAFVAAKLNHIPGYRDPMPPLMDVVRIGARSYWDSCAQTFGMNYWKPAAANDGRALCRAYRQDHYRSGLVDTWCETVLAPPGKIQSF